MNENEYTAADEYSSYKEEVGPSQSQERLNTLQEDITTTPEEFESQRERVMFEKYVQDSGERIPANYKNAGAWFDSLKEAQKQYTQGQQEIAALKDQYTMGGTQNPEYAPGTAPQPQQQTTQAQQTAAEQYRQEELRLRTYAERMPELPEPGLTEDAWNRWANELAVTGEMSPETRSEIMYTTGFPGAVVDDYILGQKAKRKESFDTAAQIVGSKEHLQTIFDWAEINLSPEEQDQVNMGLASPSYEVTLRGLDAMFKQRSAQAAMDREPGMTPNLQQVTGVDTGFVGYKTKREFTADRNNPRFKLEPQFRGAVEQRMMRTNFNSLPA